MWQSFHHFPIHRLCPLLTPVGSSHPPPDNASLLSQRVLGLTKCFCVPTPRIPPPACACERDLVISGASLLLSPFQWSWRCCRQDDGRDTDPTRSSLGLWWWWSHGAIGGKEERVTSLLIKLSQMLKRKRKRTKKKFNPTLYWNKCQIFKLFL